jgi:hypothetical protein
VGAHNSITAFVLHDDGFLHHMFPSQIFFFLFSFFPFEREKILHAGGQGAELSFCMLLPWDAFPTNQPSGNLREAA